MMASSSTTTPSSSSSRTHKHDPAWAHCQTFKAGDRTQLKCIYCGKKFSGGGIHRIKEHLAGQKGNTTVCPKVLPDVQSHMLHSLVQSSNSRKKPKLSSSSPSQSQSQSQSQSPPLLPFLPSSHNNTNNNNDNVGMDNNNNNEEEEEGEDILHLVNPPPLPPPPPAAVHDATTITITTNPSGFSLTLPRKRHKQVVRRNDAINSFFAHAAALPATIKGLDLVAKETKERAYMAIARFLYDIHVPIDALNSSYFQPMIDAIASVGPPGLEAPTYHDLRGCLLKNTAQEVNNSMDRLKEAWPRTGSSVMADTWTDKAGKTVIDFFIYCSQGTMFLKSMDATDALKSIDALYGMFKQVIEEIGVGNVVQIITDNAEIFVDAGKQLTETYPTMFWTPCSIYCIDLMFRDITYLEPVKTIIRQAKSITKFIYNRCIVLNMMRKHTGGKELLHPIATGSAASFHALQSMVDIKDNLKTMVTSQDWMNCTYSKNPAGISVADLICCSSFWSSCVGIIRSVKPLLRVLHMINNDEGKPSMGYIYQGMRCAKEAIKKALTKKKTDYMTYLSIIDSRWDKHLHHHPLHAAGFFLNPRFFYNVQEDVHNEVMSGMLDCIERMVPNIEIQDKINKELLAYKNASGDLGRNMAIRARHTLLPAEWWSTYGGGCPNLQRLAIRILGQTCTGKGGCERNWSILKSIHMKRRNQIEHRRLMDLVFVQYNLRLQQRQLLKKKPLDPCSLDNIDIIDEWVIENEMPILEDDEDTNWMAVDQPVATGGMQSGLVKNDDIEEAFSIPGFEDEEETYNSEDGNEGGDYGDNYNNGGGGGCNGVVDCDDNKDGTIGTIAAMVGP